MKSQNTTWRLIDDDGDNATPFVEKFNYSKRFIPVLEDYLQEGSKKKDILDSELYPFLLASPDFDRVEIATKSVVWFSTTRNVM